MGISIAMATYNGERFLLEQLESLAVQTVLPHELVACDDGSTDATLSILEGFATLAPFPVHIHRNDRRLGYGDNFLKAASLTTGDWIAFADQDDVWLPEKLARVGAAASSDPDIVLVIHSVTIVDETLRPSRRQYKEFEIKRRALVRPLHHKTIRTYWGLCLTFRRALLDVSWAERGLELAARPDGTHGEQAHDSWICLIANALGTTCYLPDKLVLYRRHGRVLMTQLKA